MQCTLESNQAAIDYRLRSAMSPCRSGKSAVNTAIQFSRARRATTKRSQHDQIAKQRMRFLDALNLSHANDRVHRAAANDSPLESRAARGSVCNALLSRVFRFGFTVYIYNKFNWQVVLWSEFFGIETILRPVNHARQFPILRWDQREPIKE